MGWITKPKNRSKSSSLRKELTTLRPGGYKLIFSLNTSGRYSASATFYAKTLYFPWRDFVALSTLLFQSTSSHALAESLWTL